ncbi:MAG: hypothetical protein ACLQUY_26525 [Ktedonobacterales bacterium]
MEALSRLGSRPGDGIGRLLALLRSLRAPRRTRAFLTSDRLPLVLIAGLLVSAVITVFVQAHNYGVTLDEDLQERLGRHLLAWYGTLGRDTSFLTVFPADEHMPEHGGIFDTVVAAVQYILHVSNPNSNTAVLIRHTLNGLCGVAGLVGIALCGYELAGAWVAFVAALGLWLYPRYYGAIYSNPKDVPAAVTLIFVLWATLLLIRVWNQPQRARRVSLLLGFFLGLAAAVRVTALIWFAVLTVLLAAWWLFNGADVRRASKLRAELVKQGILVSIIGISSMLSMMALWPYIFIDPVAHLITAIEVMSHYPWNGLVLYQGTLFKPTQLPPSYVPVWLVIGSPPMLILLAVLGFSLFCTLSLHTRRIDPQVGTVVLAFVVPFAALIALHPVLYDGLRQFLFLIPPLILLAAWGLVKAVTALVGRRELVLRLAAAALILVTLTSCAVVIRDMAALSPYEYIYFSPIVGGLPGAAGKYDTDYWAACSKQSAEWLVQNYSHYTRSSAPTVSIIGSAFQFLITPYLPSSFKIDDNHPDFFIAQAPVGNDQLFPTYPVIHTVSVEGVALCVIRASPAIAPSASPAT